MEYLLLLLDFGLMGPQMSEWISSNLCEALQELSFGIAYLCCLPTIQFVHTWEDSWSFGRPLIISFCARIFSPLMLRWPYLQCHRYVLPSLFICNQERTITWAAMANILFVDILLDIRRHLSLWKTLHMSCLKTIVRFLCWSWLMLRRLFFNSGM